MGDKKINLEKTMWIVTLIIGGLASLIMIYTFFDAATSIFTYGFYLALLASMGIVIAAYFFKSRGKILKMVLKI